MAGSSWGDYNYIITQVSYNKDGKHIEQVKIATVLPNNKFGQLQFRLRSDVVTLLKTNSIVTAPPDKLDPSKIRIGDKVIATTDGFIRTVGNTSKYDNLGELPEF